MNSKIIYITVMFLLLGLAGFSQTFNINQITSPVTTCSATLYDSGGPNGEYSNGENYTVTFCGENNASLIVELISMRTESLTRDFIKIYDGPNTGSALLATIGGSTMPTQLEYMTTGNCVTITWQSDYSVTYAGFELDIRCNIPCQNYNVTITPDARYDATEEAYLGCSGSTVSAMVNFPNNNVNYEQTIANTNFSWNVLNGTGSQIFAGLGMNELSEELAPGAYFYTLTTTDMNGCQVVSNTVTVYISVPPTFAGTTATPEICPGDAAEIVGVVNQPAEWEMTIEEVNYEQHCFDDDHINEEQTSCFSYAAFPGQYIQSASDIESIGMQIEHSWMNDLQILLQCPNGQRISLFNRGCDGGYFGQAVDCHIQGTNSCNDGPQWVGVGYDYYWTMSDNRGLMTANCPGSSTPLPSGYYQPVGSFEDLVGCPINGEWCVIFVDNLSQDDGTVFQTELHFADYLIPADDNIISFQNTYDLSETSHALTWSGDNIFQDTVASTIATPEAPGQHEYTFYATDNFGCTYDTTLTVNVRAYGDPRCCIEPTPYAGADARVCADHYTLSATPLPAGNEGRWSVVLTPEGGNATFAAQNSPVTNVFVDTWGTYRFRWTEAYLGNYESCSTFDDVIVEFYPQPTNTFTYLPVRCYADATTITYLGNMTMVGSVANNATYYWDFDGGIMESGSGAGPYSVYWTDEEASTHAVTLHIEANGCVSEDTVVHIFTPSKLEGEITTVDNICYRDCRGSATVEAVGGTLPYSYSWSAPSNVIYNLCVGEYTVTVIDANGCQLPFEYEIMEPDELTVVEEFTKDLSCYNSFDGEARIRVSGGTGQMTYMWSDIGIATARRRNLAAGEYRVTVTDSHGCSLSREFIVNQPDPLIVMANNNSAVCEGTVSFVQATAIGGTMPYIFNWTPSNGTSVGNTPSFETTLHETTSFSVYVTDDHNCHSNTETFTITVSPQMVVDSMILVHNTCFGSCDGSAEIVMHGGLQPYQYLWGSDNYIYRGLCAGLYTVTIVDNIGCNVNTYFIITQPSQMYSNTMTTAASCGNTADGTASINVQGGVPPYSYLWPNGETTYNITAVPGEYVVTVTDDHDCRLESSITVDGPTPIYILPMSNQTICNGQTMSITTQVAGGTPFYSYIWSNQDSVISYSNILTVTPTSNSTYTLTVTDANGCTAESQPVTVTLNPPLNIRAVTTSYDTICPGTGAIINVESEGGNGGPYTLTIDNGVIVPAPFTITLDTTTMVHITLSDMCGTTPVSDSILINVRPNPDTLFTVSTIAGCAPLAVRFTPFLSVVEGTLWEFGDYAFSDAKSPTHIYKQEGTYNVSLEVSDDFGCHFYKTYNNLITVYPKPKAMFDTDPQITGMLDSEIEFINYSTGAERYFWFFGDNDSSLFENPRHTYRRIGEFEVMLVAESENYCRDSSIRNVIIQNEFAFYAPTSFTPNGDHVNDCFRICGNGITRNNFMLAVYDRWGALVFTTDVYDSAAGCESCGKGAWDGTDMGNKIKGDAVCPPGIYQWFCTFEDWNGVVHNKQGTVMLIR